MPSGWPSPMASDWGREFSRRRCAWDRIRAARRKLEYPTRERGYVVCSALSSVAETEALTEEEDFQGMGLFVRCVFLGVTGWKRQRERRRTLPGFALPQPVRGMKSNSQPGGV